MASAEETTTKSSNEILTELFGAFNAEPPIIKIKSKRKHEGEDNDSKHSKKSKKSKKKHKSKRKKKKSSDCDVEDGPGSGKKKKKSKEKRSKKGHSSPHSVNIELPVNKVPMALEIMLDGTVGIKGEDGVITKIPDVCDSDKVASDTEPQPNVNGCEHDSTNDVDEVDRDKVMSKTEDAISGDMVSKSKMPEVFESKIAEGGGKLKKGKIQIKDLKFSSVFQETVRAAEELKKKEEGELSNTTEDEQDSDALNSLRRSEHSRHKHESRSRHRHRREHSHSKKNRSIRSRSTSTSRHHLHNHSRKRYRSRSRDYSHHHSHKHSHSQARSHHSRSRVRHRSRSRSDSRSRSSDRRPSRDTHRSRSKESRRHSEDKNKERSEPEEKIDKEKLLAIARKNALKLIDAGVVPGAEKMTAIKAGGKTVNELTEYCKKLSEKEALGDDLSDIDSDSSDDDEKPFHHPFQVKDRPNSIIMNIKNSIPLPVKSLQEKAAEQAKQLRLQFPVSSGTSHRRNESEWVPVSPKKEEISQFPPQKAPPVVSAPPMMPLMPMDNHVLLPPPQPPVPFFMSAVPPPQPPNRPMFPIIQPNPPALPLDISAIVSKRLEAIRKLQENPNDSHALNQMYSAQQEMQYWAESKQETGAFTGSTGVKVLSPSELSSGAQAWAKRDQLTSATPVRGGMGMTLLQKMGWQPGEGLGKNKEGTLEPLKLEIKTDKKGLLAPDESCRGKKSHMQHSGPPLPAVKNLEGKHPVSLLNEFCSRRRFGIPQFELCFECGPDHKKNFLFKVRVNGIEYTPSVASPNKKQAKAEAAAVCLRSLGIIPSEPPPNPNF